MRIPQGDLPPSGPALRHHHLGPPACPHRRVSRRSFIGAAAGVGGLALASTVAGPGVALARGSRARPRPIPGGIQPFGPGTQVFHLVPPEIGAEPSTITDFNGVVGLAVIRGEGWATDTATGDKTKLTYEVDQRFMKGQYVALDGERHRSTFGFI
jgi:hypothetical protein